MSSAFVAVEDNETKQANKRYIKQMFGLFEQSKHSMQSPLDPIEPEKV